MIDTIAPQGLKKVLLIDDDRVTNMMHTRVLSRSGLIEQIDIATDGQDALDYLGRLGGGDATPELILLDINMPRMDGFEFLEEYARLPEHLRKGHIIIMLTTSLLESDRERADASPWVLRFANKPVKAEDVPDMVQAYWDTRTDDMARRA
ncbi:MAG: response regulator [Arenibacterium sp.]